LVVKVEGGPRIAPGTARMPLGGAPLSAAQIDAIRQWIGSLRRDGGPLGTGQRSLIRRAP
jgi:hypothetical protein